MKRTITYQIGVDVLGFPIYVQHEVYQDKPPKNPKQYDDPAKWWVKVIETIFKQN